MHNCYFAQLMMVALLVCSQPGYADHDQQPLFSAGRELSIAAGNGSREPGLTMTADEQILLSWLEPNTTNGFALRFARLTDNEWSSPHTIVEGENWFVNWADFPALSPMGSTGLAAYWLVKNGDGQYSYDLHIALSDNNGKSWNDSIIPHRDRTQTQHGFPSTVPLPDGRLFIAWLDGRINAKGMENESAGDLPFDRMTLRSATLNNQGLLADEQLLDERVCTCCATASVLTDEGVLIAYRDRSSAEIRDISTLLLENDAPIEKKLLSPDGWEIAGCPINGPALASQGKNVVAAWFTAPGNEPRTMLAFSSNGGKDFDMQIRVDDGKSLGRTDLLLLSDGSALVSWLEVSPQGEELRVRRITKDGHRGKSYLLLRSNRGRTMGFPRMVRRNEKIYVAWTQPGDSLSIRSVELTLAETGSMK